MENLGCLERNISGTDGNEGCLDTVEFPTLNESIRMKGVNREDTVDKQKDSGDDKGIQQVCEQHDHQAPECNNDKQSNDGSESAKQNKNTKKTYAKATTSNAVKYDNKLSHIPTEVDNEGVSRGGYARVLVEVQAHKDLPAKIDVLYKNSLNEVLGTKIVQVAYCWKPPCCKGCGVFGHNDEFCPNNVDSNNGSKDLRSEVEAEGEVENRKDKKQNGMNNGNNNNDKGYFGNKGNSRKNDKVFSDQNRIVIPKKENDKEKNVNKRNSNKFEVLGNLDDETREILDMEARGIVDVFINQKRKPSSEEQAKWNEDMLCYFRARWEELVSNNKTDCKNNQGCNSEMEDVFTDKSGIGLCMEKNEVIGSDANILQDC
ncbi:zinc knuckle CX2CX4HX4C [Artemisia annua]|uniref:Zinc knuckle CX2CX4HX4C n=1 Tax=Artemisia annua TaxID=35608 RepID=A0A2U1QDF4_ARTAN|nr:zinc knuckle CX2CX4HX4C [Artemisia annua]